MDLKFTTIILKFQAVVFWVLKLCSNVGYQCFRGQCHLHLQGEVEWWWK